MTTVTNPPLPGPESTEPGRVPYWRRYLRTDGTWIPSVEGSGPPGEELADLRSGLGQPAGSVMALWPYYATETDGELTPELLAEHGAVTLYGLHQQGQNRPMHQKHVNLGRALRRLRDSEKFLDSALDRRVEAAATTTSVPALLYRLRGLITQLRGQGIPLDYDQLMRDLRQWSHPERRQWVRRRWGLAYYARGGQGSADSNDATAADSTAGGTTEVPPGT
ncbi:type I-E CRISPR-associated protein Cse2/CasB [Streptomyces sp. NPDC053474]|uniref:type I-E CRISPR-associated protein Cse2/CasB n=1 Tax=Streptomyces sp. NPDC053474 TaxID=3365704 RepID=UPI0037D15261